MGVIICMDLMYPRGVLCTAFAGARTEGDGDTIVSRAEYATKISRKRWSYFWLNLVGYERSGRLTDLLQVILMYGFLQSICPELTNYL